MASIDQKIDVFFQPVAETMSGIVFYSIPLVDGVDVKLILVWLALATFFFSFYLGFVNIRYFKHALDVLFGKFDKKNDKSDGQISRFQALSTSLSGTVGLGNIAGVAVAVSIGGPGAVFWMVLMGFLAMSLKFAEVTLAVKYRVHADVNHPSRIAGGPMYYLQEAFNQFNMKFMGKFMAGFFALCCIGGSIGGGNMFQANQAYQQVLHVSGGDASFLADKGWIFGLFLAFLVGLVIIGGLKSIAAVASKLVPAMGLIYVTAGLVVIAIFYQNIPDALLEIFQGAFSMEAGLGGFLGGLLVGVQRASFSNEAGLGSAAIVHSNAKTDEPVSQGFVGMLGPFIDTVIICLITALVIVISGAHHAADGVEGVALTSRALEFGVSWFPYVLSVTVFLFAYSTMITWCYYGLRGVTYLFGYNDAIEMAFKLFFCLCVVIGCSAELHNIISFTDAMILSMGIPNIIGLYLLAGVVKKDLKEYQLKYFKN